MLNYHVSSSFTDIKIWGVGRNISWNLRFSHLDWDKNKVPTWNTVLFSFLFWLSIKTQLTFILITNSDFFFFSLKPLRTLVSYIIQYYYFVFCFFLELFFCVGIDFLSLPVLILSVSFYLSFLCCYTKEKFSVWQECFCKSQKGEIPQWQSV